MAAPLRALSPALAGRIPGPPRMGSTDWWIRRIHRAPCWMGDPLSPQPSDAGAMSTIEVRNLHSRYAATVAVDDVSFTVEAGVIFGILGPNGAGKTTTVECVAGLRVPDRGEIRVLGLDPRHDRAALRQRVGVQLQERRLPERLRVGGAGVRVPGRGGRRGLGPDPRHDRAALRQRVGVQLQESRLPERLRVGEAIALYRSFYPQPADGDQLLEMLGLTDKRRSRYRDLSGGQKQRLSIALALIGRPTVAVLDELTTGLDPQARRETWELVERVRDSGVTIILV